MNPQMLFEAGQIVGMLMRHSVSEWDDLRDQAEVESNKPVDPFRYGRHISLLADLRRELNIDYEPKRKESQDGTPK